MIKVYVRFHFRNSKAIQDRNYSIFLPISLELVIESELCPSCHSFGGEEANTELAIHSPLQRVQWIRNAKQDILHGNQRIQVPVVLVQWGKKTPM